MVPGLGIFPDVINASIYLSTGNYEEALWSGLGAIPIVGDATTGVRNVNKLNKAVNSGGRKNKVTALLPGEGDVGTFRELTKKGFTGDNVTPHHIPSKKYMEHNFGVKMRDGVSINVEQPSPGKGGRHRRTYTYGGMTKENKDKYLQGNPRDILAQDVMDLRKIYMEDGLYTKGVRAGLKEVVRLNKEKYTGIFNK